jgi:hypothetical protein
MLQTFTEIQIPNEPVPGKSIPIPPRIEPLRTTSVESRPQVGSSLRTGEQSFVEQAKELSAKTVWHAVFTPFMAYWPTYGSMTAAQTQWYFYWREKVQGSEYPQTDLSYIFLYVYELINLVGCRSPLEGYQKLMAIWRAYRTAFPKLDGYLKDWVSDFVLLHGLKVPAEEIFNLCDSMIGWYDLDLLLLNKFREKPLSIDVSLLSRGANYDIRQSKFYQSASALICDEYIPKVVALVDAFLEKQQGRRIIDIFHPGLVQRERYLFQSALYADQPRSIQVNVVPLTTHSPLRDFLAQVIRHTENKLRKIKNYHGKLRGIELEEDLGRLIDEYLERELIKKPEKRQPNITLDVNKLARAAAEAEQTQRMLMLDVEKEHKGADVHDLRQEAAETGAAAPVSVCRHDAPDGLRAGVAPVTGLFTQRQHSARRAQAHTGGKMVVNATGNAIGNEAGLNKEWRELGRKLSPCQLDMLQALVRGSSSQELQRIAEQDATMVEAVLDCMNEAAMEIIGDLLIEDGAVLEEYSAQVKALFLLEDENT